MILFILLVQQILIVFLITADIFAEVFVAQVRPLLLNFLIKSNISHCLKSCRKTNFIHVKDKSIHTSCLTNACNFVKQLTYNNQDKV